MIVHSDVRRNIARAIAEDAQILEIAREGSGRGLMVYCDRWAADGMPDESESPACFVFSDGYGEDGQSDESTYPVIVRFAVASDRVIAASEVATERSATANGLAICEGARIAERLRDRAVEIVRSGEYGAFVLTVERGENTFAGWPLVWSDVEFVMFEPEIIP